MKMNVKIFKEVDITKVKVIAGVRYWVDCEFSHDGIHFRRADNDDDETDDEFKSELPFVEKRTNNYEIPGPDNNLNKLDDYWCITIDVNEGKVENWPDNFWLTTHFKICDDGLYTVEDDEGNIYYDSIKSRDYYVPSFLAIDDDGYGDYMYLTIDNNGYIKNWKEIAIPRIKKYLMNNE